MSDTFTHFVFVDFENVTTLDLGLVEGKPIHVTLLIGKKQTKLDTTLSLQLNKYAEQVDPVRVETSGPNALDIILACYLGQSVARNPRAQFTIVSKDKDFEPMLAHLSSMGTKVTRQDSFAAVLQPAPRTVTPSKPRQDADKFDKFVQHLRNSPPSDRIKLDRTILAFFKPSLPVGGKKGVITELKKRSVIAIDPTGKVKFL